MTSAETLGCPAAGSAAPTRPKTLLTCPRCGHESPADGDWAEAVVGERIELRCPACAAHLTSRRR